MIDTACIALSLVAVFWVAVRASMLDSLLPWVERLKPRQSAHTPNWPPPGS